MTLVQTVDYSVIVLVSRRLEVSEAVEGGCWAWERVVAFQCCSVAAFGLVEHRPLLRTAVAVAVDCDIADDFVTLALVRR